MKHFNGTGIIVVCLSLWLSACVQAQRAARPKAPFKYVWGKAYHILPETHSDESGYFSLCEGRNGRMYVGTTKYGINGYLVEFNPKTRKQRIVIDVHKLCGIKAKGMKAQSKIHTRNFVGRSGKIYVGSKQGYPVKGENPFDYPGGYLMTYDPKADKATNLGKVPFRGHGIIDVTADESRGIIYVVSQDDQNRQSLWLRYDTATKEYQGLYSNLTFFALTLLDRRGHAHALSDQNRLVSYDPGTGELKVRKLLLDGKPLKPGEHDVPTWVIARDGRTVYLIYMTKPALYRFDLLEKGPSVNVKKLGDCLKTDKNTDSRSALSMGPDGNLYAVIRENNQTGFGGGYLHHLIRYNCKTEKIEDLGVLAVKNPDFFDFAGKKSGGKKPPWSHGYHKLPDGTLTPLHCHMALILTRKGTAYITIIYPFTLLEIKRAVKLR